MAVLNALNVYEYAKNCLEDADQYKPDKVMAEFYQTMEEYWK